MFTGIIRQMGEILAIKSENNNRIFEILAHFPEKIRIDQSIAHNGVCLTVTDLQENADGKVKYAVTAVKETLDKTDLITWEVGDKVNLELCMKPNERLDGHFVQGHVDTIGKVIEITEVGGSWMFEFYFSPEFAPLLVDKGSVTISGVSLTVVKAEKDHFNVTIIPYTYQNTLFHRLKVGSSVNLEFDILGKYIQRLHQLAT
jgi:riboflavin synthase